MVYLYNVNSVVEVVPVASTRGHPRSPCDHYHQAGSKAKTPAAHGRWRCRNPQITLGMPVSIEIAGNPVTCALGLPISIDAGASCLYLQATPRNPPVD